MTISASFKDALIAAIGTRARIYAYADPNDFRSLWDLQADHAKRLDTASDLTQPIVVVWDGSPPEQQPSDDDMLLFQQLSALDWAFAYSIKALRDSRLRGTAKFNIVIVDLSARLDQSHWASSMLHQLVASMPWLTLVAPLAQAMNSTGPSRYPVWNPVLEVQDAMADAPLGDRVRPFLMRVPEAAGAGGTFTLNPSILGPTLADAASEECVQQLATLARQWAASMGRVDEHHDLNNVIGPGVVAELLDPSTSANPGSLFVAAFMNRLRWAGLMKPLMKAHEDQDRQGKPGNELASRQGSPLDILVVDDRLYKSAGGVSWGTVLARLLELEPKDDAFGLTAVEGTTPSPIATIASGDGVKLWGTIDPTALLEPLGISATEDAIRVESANFQHRRYDSPIPSATGMPPTSWCLLLDLRLFGRHRARARDWYRTLGGAAKQLVEFEHQLPWPGFKQDIARIESWLVGNIDPTDPQELPLALSLLPRLCALRWPTVPVILFSSAQDRRLLERLAPYANIDLASPKPDVLRGELAEQVDTFKYRFLAAIKRAGAEAQLHAFLGRLEAYAQTITRVTLQPSDGNELGNIENSAEAKAPVHLECYIDESGNSEEISEDEPFVISAVVALYENEQSAEAWNARMLEGSFSLDSGWPLSGSNTYKFRYGTSWKKKAALDCSKEMPKQGVEIYTHLFEQVSKDLYAGELVDTYKKTCPLHLPWKRLFGELMTEEHAPPKCECKIVPIPHDSKDENLRNYLARRLLSVLKFDPKPGETLRTTAKFECKNSNERRRPEPWRLPDRLLEKFHQDFLPDLPIDLEAKLYAAWGQAITKLFPGSSRDTPQPVLFCFHIELEAVSPSSDAISPEVKDLFLDGRYDEAVGQLIEGICFDFFATLAQGISVESSRIIMGTRNLGLKDKNQLKDLFYRWGAQPLYEDRKEPPSPIRDFRINGRNQYLSKLREVLNQYFAGDRIDEAIELITKIECQQWDAVEKLSGVRSKKELLPEGKTLTDKTCLNATDFHDGRIISIPDNFLESGSPVVIAQGSPGMYVRAMHRRRTGALLAGLANKAPKLTGAAAFKLSNASADVRPRVIHGMADFAPRLYGRSRATTIPLVQAHVGTIYGEPDPAVVRLLLNACQSVDSNERATAMRHLMEALGRPQAQRPKRSEGASMRLTQAKVTGPDLLVAKVSRVAPDLNGIEIRSIMSASVTLIENCLKAVEILSPRNTSPQSANRTQHAPTTREPPSEDSRSRVTAPDLPTYETGVIKRTDKLPLSDEIRHLIEANILEEATPQRCFALCPTNTEFGEGDKVLIRHIPNRKPLVFAKKDGSYLPVEIIKKLTD